MKLGLHLPINSVSFGQISVMLLRTLFDREKAGDKSLEIYLFANGQVDLSAYAVDQEFQAWLQSKMVKAMESYNRDIPIFKLWHLNGSLESFSKNQTLFSFYELDNPTKVEINVAKNNKLAFSSNYTINTFKIFGVDTTYLPLAFDSYSFSKLSKTYHTDGRIVFNVCGKLERRKHHAKVIQAWMKKYGNNTKYWLQCATYNPFLNQEQNNELIRQIINGPKPFNVNFFPMMQQNAVYNDFLNSADVVLGMSGGEGWGLPEFQSVALGKHAVILNAHGYQTWANDKNATLVMPSGKVSSVDNIFFRQGDAYNQGQLFDWNTDDFIDSCETTIKKVEANRVNEAGLELQKQYTKEAFADNVIKLTTT